MRLELHLARPDELHAPGSRERLEKAVRALRAQIEPDLPKLPGDGSVKALGELEALLTGLQMRHADELTKALAKLLPKGGA